MSYYEIPRSNFYQVIIIGAGPCGLATASRLCEPSPGAVFSDDEAQRFQWLRQRKGRGTNLIQGKKKEFNKCGCYSPQDILVLDAKSDKWMGQWNSQFKSCGIPYLRSPMFFHPDPVEIDAMVTFAHEQNRWDELKEIPNVVGKEFSKHQWKKRRNSKSGKSRETGLVTINQRDWKDYHRPSTPLFWDFCQQVVDRYKLSNNVTKARCESLVYCQIGIIEQDGSLNPDITEGFIVTTEDGDVYCCSKCVLAVGHSGKINYTPSMEFPKASCHTTELFDGKVKLSDLQSMDHVVVVGGGLTSAQICQRLLAHHGVKHVTLLIRSALKVKHFDFHLDWVTKYKNVKKSAFWMKDTDEERLEMIQEAREGGSVNPEYHKIILALQKTGRLSILTHTQIKKQEFDPNLSKWDLSLNTDEKIPPADYIVFATGIAPTLETLPFMKQIVENYPIDFINGFPCLTDDLQWSTELPLFVIGKYASLRIGPSSANLDGARLGAERIGWFLQHLHNIETRSQSDEEELEFQLASGALNWYSLLTCEVSS